MLIMLILSNFYVNYINPVKNLAKITNFAEYKKL
jgi:hypothetical protein